MTQELPPDTVPPENPEAHDFDAAADEVQLARVLEELDREGEVKQLAALLQQEGVRDLLWRVLEKCRVYAAVYNRNFGDMALEEGKRQIGLWLLNEICEADPAAEMRMRHKAVQLAHLAAQKSRRKRPPRS